MNLFCCARIRFRSFGGFGGREGAAFGVRRSAFSVQRSAFSVQRSAFSVQRSAFSVQRRTRVFARVPQPLDARGHQLLGTAPALRFRSRRHGRRHRRTPQSQHESNRRIVDGSRDERLTPGSRRRACTRRHSARSPARSRVAAATRHAVRARRYCTQSPDSMRGLSAIACAPTG
ncbi:hypothetical protein X945_5685 [Burkholderia pseudomallei ABCPW 107]|nr:hypothetical protein X945_5685 [Burkholderia pseudomallei ABCPW 107]